MSYDLWEPRRRIEMAYLRAIRGLNKRVERELDGIDDPNEIVRILKNLMHSEAFQVYTEAAATKMVTSLFADTGRTWRQAARHNSMGRDIFEALMHELDGPVGSAAAHRIAENARLISSIPEEFRRTANRYIAEQAAMGNRGETVAKELRRQYPQLSQARAALIARTEVAKTNTAITEMRSQVLGIDWYIWRTCRDQRVRDSHGRMDGVLVRWSEPPSPEKQNGEKPYGNYHPGGIFNCRCYPEPVVSWRGVNWPCKVYAGGRILITPKKKFEDRFGRVAD